MGGGGAVPGLPRLLRLFNLLVPIRWCIQQVRRLGLVYALSAVLFVGVLGRSERVNVTCLLRYVPEHVCSCCCRSWTRHGLRTVAEAWAQAPPALERRVQPPLAMLPLWCRRTSLLEQAQWQQQLGGVLPLDLPRWKVYCIWAWKEVPIGRQMGTAPEGEGVSLPPAPPAHWHPSGTHRE